MSVLYEKVVVEEGLRFSESAQIMWWGIFLYSNFLVLILLGLAIIFGLNGCIITVIVPMAIVVIINAIISQYVSNARVKKVYYRRVKK